jgi:CubicO group peptidase (beta-lactamase class C family)
MLIMKKLLFFLFLPIASFAQNKSSLFDSYMQAQADLYGFNGNVLVSKRGKVIYKKSFGYADYDAKLGLDDNNVFDCGSIAKEFTAMGILLLIDKGQIKYSDTLRRFFPELPYANLTVRQLLTHTSGMPDGFELVEKYFDHSKIATNDDLIRLLMSKKPALLFNPGENLMYSGTGFNLLASIIEKVSGQSYTTYMYERVFKRLGMKHTQVSNGRRSAKSIPGYASGFSYSDSLKKYLRTDSQHSGWTTYLAGITGEGMIITTTGDLLIWDRALKNHILLTEATQQEMLSLQAEKKFPAVSFGYGMRVGKNQFGNYIFHNGYYPGYMSMHLRYTGDDVTVIVLSNNESHSDFIADGLAAITLNKDILLPYVHKELLHGKLADKYAGKYMMQLTRPPYMAVFPIEFVHRNDTLYIHSVFGADIRLRQESTNKFFYADGTDQQIEFKTDNNGKLMSVWHIAWGVKRELKEIE